MSVSAIPRRVRVLGCPVDVVDMDAAVERLVGLVDDHRGGRLDRPGVVVTLNSEMVVQAQRDAGFRAILERAALIIPDGIGVVRALRRRGHPGAQRVTGADLLDAYFAKAAGLGHRIALVGAASGVATTAANRYRRRYPGLEIVLADAGDPTLVTVGRLRAAKPDVVCAAYGHGCQERFLADHLSAIGAACGVGIGGSLDYIAGTQRRAPRLIQRAGMEWAWRLLLQPRRLRRQMALPAFWLRERREAQR